MITMRPSVHSPRFGLQRASGRARTPPRINNYKCGQLCKNPLKLDGEVEREGEGEKEREGERGGEGEIGKERVA